MMVAASLSLLLAASAPTSVTFEQTTVAHVGDQAAGPGVVARVFYAGKRMRLEPVNAPAGTALVLRLDEGKAWRLDPSRRQAVALDLQRMRDESQMDVNMAGQLMGVVEGGVRTESLAEARLIDGHRCQG